MQVRISLTGDATLARRFRKAPHLLRRILADVTKTTAKETERGARRRVPVLTGALRSAIQATQVGEFAWRVGVEAGHQRGRVDPVKYGPYVEFGTVKMAARPYMRPAAEEQRARIPARVAAAADKWLGQVAAA